MPDLGWQELAIIMVIVIIIFGAGRLPEIGGALGKSIKEFKANTEGIGELGKPKTTQTTVGTEATTANSGATVNVAREVRSDEI
jgi:sec-independent protein translocase protein TatA